MLSRFFLDRPVFAWVIAIIIMVLGSLAIYNLPVSQYPPIAPPSIAIEGFYPGGSAETVENSVTQIIEQKMTGFDDLLYLSGTSDSAGGARVELTFQPGTDPDLAWAKVQNKLQLAMANLPDPVQRSGLMVNKSTRNFLLIVALVSEDGSMDGTDLRDFAVSNLEKTLARIPGVGEVMSFGSPYAMRIWLDPDKLTSYRLTIEDVQMALRAYNVEIAAGQFGGLPAEPGQKLNASIIVQNLLKTPEEFAAIPIRTNPDGSVVRIRDVGRAELGAENYDVQVQYNGKPCAGLAIRQAPGANALETADLVKAKLAEMSPFFPPGLKVVYPFDTTPFIRVAIHEVVKTLFEAVLLVFLVMWLFMGNIRATLIPTIAVPVVLLGTLASLAAFGFSINMLTMFAMVLSIGLLVDDAIVVVENVERIMSEEGLSPREATKKSMDQITSALIGIGLVLSAVFGPMAFFPGSTGIIYRQFSITIVTSMLLSVLVALVLTPVLCASLLKPVPKGHEPSENATPLLRPFLLRFDRAFFWVRDRYLGLVGHSLAKKFRYLLMYAVLLGGIGFLLMRLPTSFLPDEDQGVLFTVIMTPTGTTLEQTQAVADRVREHYLQNEPAAVQSVLTVVGFGFSGRAQNNAVAFVKLRDWKDRDRPDLRAKAVVGRAMSAFWGIRNALVFPVLPPAVNELGNARGVDFQLLDRGGLGHEAFMQAGRQFMGMLMQDKRLMNVRRNGLDDVPQYRVDIDWEKAGALGVPITAIHNALASALGSSYVNDFLQAGRVKRVFLQADAPFRGNPADLDKIHVRSATGKMVPFASFATTHWTSGSPRLERFNGFPAMNFSVEPAPGHSTGEAMKILEETVAKLPTGIGYDYAGISYQERMASRQAPLLYGFSLLVIFLCVAALYESWTIPFVNLLMIPLGVFGALLATTLRGFPNDVYFQIGFLTTMGLSTKNAILIIQFIKEQRRHGETLEDATLNAVRIRFRPVIMTSLAFFFGTLPLALAQGAGAGAMNAIGTAVTGGMLSATFIDLVFIPLFFVIVSRLFGHDTNPNLFLRRANMTPRLMFPILLAAGLTGCTFAPKYTRPVAPVPDQWPSPPGPATNHAHLAWQQFYTDPKLQRVIALALEHNRDLRLASLNVQRARALYGIQRNTLYPSLYATSAGSKQRAAADLTQPGQPRVTERYSANLGVAEWEIDFFGRLRSLKDSALESYFATEQARRAAQLSLVAAVAQTWLALAADRENLTLAATTLATQRETYAIAKRRVELGLAPEIDRQRAQTQVDAARATVARFQQLVAYDENGLRLLVGADVPADCLPANLTQVAPLPALAAGLPSDVLLSRPDVLAAEHQLKAANADLGAARAAFFPRIALTSAIGTASDDLAGLFQKGNGTWSYAPQIVMPIFDARTWSAHRAAQTQRDIAVAQYEKAIQTAFREVADALASRAAISEQLAAQESLLRAATETHRLALSRYEKGLDNYLSVLDAQRALVAAQQAVVTTRLAQFTNDIRLYVVFGGTNTKPL